MVITLPIAFLSLFLTLFLKYEISSIISFIFIIVIAGAYSDITMFISILKLIIMLIFALVRESSMLITRRDNYNSR